MWERNPVDFYETVIKPCGVFNSPARVANPLLLEPVTRAAVEAIMQEAAELGQRLMLWESYRSQARQTALFKAGATQLPAVGVHHFGLAADLVKDVDGEPSWKGAFDFLGVLAVKHKLIWGGNWKGFVDAVHVQRIKVSDQTALFAGTFYPDATYNPYS